MVEKFKSESKKWHQKHFGNLADKIKEKKEEHARIQQSPPSPALLQEEHEISKHLEEFTYH